MKAERVAHDSFSKLALINDNEQCGRAKTSIFLLLRCLGMCVVAVAVAVAVEVEVAVAVLLSSGTPVNFIWVEQFRTRRLQSDNLYKPANIIW